MSERPVTIPGSSPEFVDACAGQWFLDEFLCLEPGEDEEDALFEQFANMNVQDHKSALIEAFKAGFRKAEETLDRRLNRD